MGSSVSSAHKTHNQSVRFVQILLLNSPAEFLTIRNYSMILDNFFRPQNYISLGREKVSSSMQYGKGSVSVTNIFKFSTNVFTEFRKFNAKKL